MSEQTREHRIGYKGKESVYLTSRFGGQGMMAYSEVKSGRQSATELEAKLRGANPATDDDKMVVRFMLLGVEMARKARNTAGSIQSDQDAAVLAMRDLERETVNKPVEIVREAQPTTCRHGVPFNAVCAACDDDF